MIWVSGLASVAAVEARTASVRSCEANPSGAGFTGRCASRRCSRTSSTGARATWSDGARGLVNASWRMRFIAVALPVIGGGLAHWLDPKRRARRALDRRAGEAVGRAIREEQVRSSASLSARAGNLTARFTGRKCMCFRCVVEKTARTVSRGEMLVEHALPFVPRGGWRRSERRGPVPSRFTNRLPGRGRPVASARHAGEVYRVSLTNSVGQRRRAGVLRGRPRGRRSRSGCSGVPTSPSIRAVRSERRRDLHIFRVFEREAGRHGALERHRRARRRSAAVEARRAQWHVGARPDALLAERRELARAGGEAAPRGPRCRRGR